MGKVILMSFSESKEECAFEEILQVLRKHGLIINEYETESKSLYISDLFFDPIQMTVKKGEKNCDLNYREFQCLYLLASHKEMIFESNHLYEMVWKEKVCSENMSSVSALVSKIRSKVEDDPKHPQYILTVRDVGYRFNPDF